MGKGGRKELERVREKRPGKRRMGRKEDEGELFDVSPSLNYGIVG